MPTWFKGSGSVKTRLSAFGALYFVLALVLFILAVNYQANHVLLLSVLMLCVLLGAAYLNRRNLPLMRLQNTTSLSAFAGDAMCLQFHVKRGQKAPVYALNVRLVGYENTQWQASTQGGTLYFKVHARGQHALPAIIFSSAYPFGLFSSQRRLSVNAMYWVFPKPCASERAPTKRQSEGGDKAVDNTASQFNSLRGLRPYRQGERLSLCAWKALAAGRGMQLKQFDETQNTSFVLDERELLNFPTEQRYAILCYWVLQYAQSHGSFSLNLRTAKLALGQGEQHQLAALKLLASCP